MNDARNLENWYALGELKPGHCRLVGIVRNHPRIFGSAQISSSHEVRTTLVVAAEGRLVTTQSGTVYRLGRAHPDYILFKSEDGIVVDEEKPFGI